MLRHRTPRAAAVILPLLAVVLAAGCSSTGADEGTRSSGQQGYVGVDGNLTRIAPADRRPTPAISGPELGGSATVSTDSGRGKVRVINVWGSWCPPCRKEAVDLQQASVETKNIAQFVGVNVRDNDPAPAEAFVRVNQVTYPSIYDPSGQVLLQLAGELPPSAIPSTLVIDQQGRLAVRALGPVTRTTLVDMITSVAAGQ